MSIYRLRIVVWSAALLFSGLFWYGAWRGVEYLAGSASVIVYDRGGRLGDYLDAMHEPQRIWGYCASGCTALLGADDVCVTPKARLVFHQASTELGTLLLFAQYPTLVQGWIKARGGLTVTLLEMSGAEAIRLGVRRC